MSHQLHLQAALAAAKAQHLDRAGFSAAARSFWRDAAVLEEAAMDQCTSAIERSRLRKSAAAYALRGGDPRLARDIMRRARFQPAPAAPTTDPPPSR